MAMLTDTMIETLLRPYLQDVAVPDRLISQLSLYLDLLVKWNARTNLTAVRDPAVIVCRHFGESLFAGLHLPTQTETLLDFGSGAGFPGLPIQLLRPKLTVTLAESQGKKSSFLHEVVRCLDTGTEIWPARVESMPVERRFDVVALRAVDQMEQAYVSAQNRVKPGGTLMILSTGRDGVAIPGSHSSVVRLVQC